jgi:hypothetical protein
MAGRVDLAHRLAVLVGDDTLRLTDVGNGWPARGRLRLSNRTVEVDIFVGPIGLSQRMRDEVERRFQNPGQRRPLTITAGRVPLLVGVWDRDPILPVARPVIVLADAYRRAGLMTRYSIFQNLTALTEAAETGWVTQGTSSGELLYYLHPGLLPLAVEGRTEEVAIPDELVQAVVLGSGLAEGDGKDLAALERVRRASSSIVRDARFGRRVIAAYSGLCAMCGLDVGLVQGAHIYPASAPNSPDETWNGLALCPTHHVAFDRHLVGVRPSDGTINYNTKVLDQVALSPAVRILVEGTYRALAAPSKEEFRPRKDMFELRYQHFVGEYDWLSS